MRHLIPNSTQIPDVILDFWMARLDGNLLKILLYVARRTFGFGKQSDNISLSQICQGIRKRDGQILDLGTGLSRSTVTRGIKSLVEKGVLLQTHNRNEKTNEYLESTFCLNLNWSPDPGKSDPEGNDSNDHDPEENGPGVDEEDAGGPAAPVRGCAAPETKKQNEPGGNAPAFHVPASAKRHLSVETEIGECQNSTTPSLTRHATPRFFSDTSASSTADGRVVSNCALQESQTQESEIQEFQIQETAAALTQDLPFKKLLVSDTAKARLTGDAAAVPSNFQSDFQSLDSVCTALIAQLARRGLNQSQAVRFAQEDPAECRRQLEFTDPLDDSEFTSSRGAYLNKAIPGKFGPPNTFMRKRQETVNTAGPDKPRATWTKSQYRIALEKRFEQDYRTYVAGTFEDWERLCPEEAKAFLKHDAEMRLRIFSKIFAEKPRFKPAQEAFDAPGALQQRFCDYVLDQAKIWQPVPNVLSITDWLRRQGKIDDLEEAA